MNSIDQYWTLISFAIPSKNTTWVASNSPECRFVIRNPLYFAGSAQVALWTLDEPICEFEYLTCSHRPNMGQFLGSFNITETESLAITGGNFSCQFGTNMEFAVLSEGVNNTVIWSQNNSLRQGAFIDIWSR